MHKLVRTRSEEILLVEHRRAHNICIELAGIRLPFPAIKVLPMWSSLTASATHSTTEICANTGGGGFHSHHSCASLNEISSEQILTYP